MRVVALLLVIGWTHCGEDDFRGTSTLWLLSRAESREGVARLQPRAAEIADQSALGFTLWPLLDDAGAPCEGRVELAVNGLHAYLTPGETPSYSFYGWHRACDGECVLPFRVTNQSSCSVRVEVGAHVTDEERSGPSCEGDFSSSSIAIEE